MKKISIATVFQRIADSCNPRLVAELNGQEVRLARMNGPFIWHAHQDADELLLVIDGLLLVETNQGNHELRPGEFIVVPRGVEHRTVAVGDVQLLMFEPAGTRNTGGVVNDLTVERPERLCD